MCGIWALFGLDTNLPQQCSSSFTKIKHRGPDAWRIEYDDRLKHGCFGFHRLAIVDSLHGMQPMKIHQYPHQLLLCNGELYNYKELRAQFGFEFETKCDVEIILHLYNHGGIENVVKNLDGVFCFILVDLQKQKVFIGRDPYGVRPGFRLYSEGAGVLGICSEAKGLISITKEMNGNKWVLEPFPPSTFEEYDLNDEGSAKLSRREKYYNIGDRPAFVPFIPYESLSSTDVHHNIRALLTQSCKKRLMAERRIGCLLSGGLDSSLIAALTLKLAKEANLPYTIQTFAIGMGDSPDIIAARQVAKHIGSDHHEIIFTEDDVKQILDDVIYSLETPDITTIRASVGMYIIARYILKNTNTRVLLSGEGADELGQGYIYFRDAPSPDAGHEESLRLLKDIYMYDGLRADRTTSAHSLELRVPFLDLQFTSYYLSLSKEMRQPQKGIEKHLLRSAFDYDNLLPHNILWRHKEAFSDGVASVKKSLFQIIQEIIDSRISEFCENTIAKQYTHCTPKTKEQLYYRQKFEEFYPDQITSFCPYFWMPKWINVTDPSARFISHYAADKE
ncbi:asparagine synthetase [glutamine-hydrolyzing] [Chrysoperla carnea]|uniref:asparagine synthetase [glutamine-hydrolyzing] n=1 Tax=Chrysoperla carnea TaxID=189513 RepID=UPI001D05FFCC|nr:asparagine synthetase [glutamine-hydrolyzing] [Chrysoperla carnea]